LVDNTAAYTSPMFFYYITRNSKDELYLVSGTPTYTRINSTSVNPTKANFVDLINGVISIENLVAGNGNFSSYLRVGSSSTSGGARIELSGVNNFTDSLTTRIVKRGITAYDSGNNEVLSFDYGAATPTLAIKGTLTGSTGVFGPVTIGTSGISSTNFNIASDGSATFNGTITANTGSIGKWKITEQALKSTEVAYPTIQLDPGNNGVNPKFEIRQSASNSSESGIKVIKIDTEHGIRAGTTDNFKFTVNMDGQLTANDAIFNNGTFNGSITSGSTITGAVFTSGGAGGGFSSGTLTINSGFISHTSGLYVSTGSSGLYLDSTNGSDTNYMIISPSLGVILGQGNNIGDLQIRLNKATIEGYVRGYLFHSLYDQFADVTTLYTTSTFGTPGSTVTINAANRLSRGRTLYTGNLSSTTALDSYLGGAFTGDLYFSTA